MPINLKIIKDAGYAGAAAHPDAGSTGPSRGKKKGGASPGGGKKGGAPVSFVDGTYVESETTGNNDILVPSPIGVQSGDLLVIVGICRNSFMATPTGGGTWTQEEDIDVAGGNLIDPSVGGNERFELWTKAAGASEPANYTVAITDDGTDGQIVMCAAFRDADSISNFSAVVTADSPSVSALDKDMLISYHGTAFSSTTSVGKPASMTQIDQTYQAASDTGAAWAYEAITDDGPTGTRTWNPDWIVAANNRITASFVVVSTLN